ncbi:hypothetical protein GMJLKIPL_2838 [Methylobacterium isbiliense]|uniref:Uncharacterized protein n=1 Tax=Methylobacterium isbiliense TaxID=315478 RepID=A0ABQ4SCE9_9HYPH|nr:hypothetical protein GMJLKIPL_2838 [Methylobacterium isbiliense]
MKSVCVFPKSVPVRSYRRFRFNRWETVTSHCRGLPQR